MNSESCKSNYFRYRNTEIEIMNQKKAYEQKLEGKLEELSATIDTYKAKAKQAGGEAQIKYSKQVDSLQVQQKLAKEKLEDFKSKSGEAWEDMKAGMESAWDSLSNAVQSAAARFND